MDTETHCHCGVSYDGSDHCPECHCEQYERDCGKRPAGTPNTVPSVAGRPQKRIVHIGHIFRDGTTAGIIRRGPLGYQR
jgi:hypothetical protein